MRDANKLLPLAVTHIAGLYQYYFDIVNHPPYVFRVTVSQNGQCIYKKYWVDRVDEIDSTKVNKRELIEACDTPGFIDKTKERVDIKIEFGSKDAGTAKKMRVDSISVAFVDESGGVCAAAGKLDDSDSVWTGGFDLGSTNGCKVDDVLTIRIEAKDRHNHYPGRTPLGDELDQSPDTPAKAVITGPVDANAPLQYGWIGYEPGVDTNHRINPEPRDEACESQVNVINGKTDGAPLEGTCGPDDVRADETYVTDPDGQANNDDTIKTYAGNDVIHTDAVSLLGADSGRNLVDAGPGDDQIIGGAGPDIVDGGPGNDILTGYDGDNVLDGGEGNDKLTSGGPYSEPYYWYAQLFGGPGNDDLLAPANALLDGGDGNDTLGSGDKSQLLGGPGDDMLSTTGRSDADGGPGNDFLSYGSTMPGIQASLEGGPGDDVFYISSVGEGSELLINGGPGANAYTFKDVKLINGVRFTGGYDAGTIYQGSVTDNVSSSSSSLTKVPLWDTYHYTTTYNAFTSAVTVTVLAGAEGGLVVGVNAQPVATFVVEYFHNGMLGITGVNGAPDAPISPIPSASDFVYLPLIQKRP